MIDMLERNAIQVLRQAGHDQADVARLVGVGMTIEGSISAVAEAT